MQAVGRIGSYISRSVYTVSGPFHPFGGAVDIIIVEQPDGSYKSSPWYVRFGKFQGVLKTKEQVVSISVNGVDADFNMYLDHKGEAFFLKEVEIEGADTTCSPPSSSGEDTDRQSKSCNGEANCSEIKAVTKTNSRRSQIFGLVFGRKSTKEEDNGSDVVRTESMERAEMAADLMDLKWSTNLASPRRENDNASRFSSAKDGVSENSKVEENGVEIKYLASEYVVETATSVERVREDSTTLNSEMPISNEIGSTKLDYHVSTAVSVVSEVAEKSDSPIQDSVENLRDSSDTGFSMEEHAADNIHSAYYCEALENSGVGLNEPSKVCVCTETVENTTQLVYVVKSETVAGEDEIKEHQSSASPLCGPHMSIYDFGPQEEEQLLFGEEKEADCLFSSQVADDAKSCPVFSLEQSVINDYLDEDNLHRIRLRSVSSDACITETGHFNSMELTRIGGSLPSMAHLGDSMKASDFGDSIEASLYLGGDSGAQTMAADVKILETSEGEVSDLAIGNSPRSIDSLRGSRRDWPFYSDKSRSIKVSQVDTTETENPNALEILNSSTDLEVAKDSTKAEVKKKIVKTLTPTSEQLASLNLNKEKNIVIFTFSTPMLGKQQVDARIFLWRWDTRVVISDVDGTITRSDLLGQVMPLVGMDWSHTGVAHLFSAIKENGYQLLFLSARSISQSFLTRQFLFNIKQDGKALPEGPVVISPDGLFPSLFREVVRRAPHEFKIACLADIKALFPADTNPFYAGFGNRDTDEFSYLKVGIPRGKIFIINPKGEIAVNRRIDTKSYSSLHALVHGMFPTTSSSSSDEQEDYNSWNFWKLPPPVIDL